MIELKRAEPKDAFKISTLIRSAMSSYQKDSGIPQNMLESLSEDVTTVEDRIKNNICLCFWDGPEPIGTITLSVTDTPVKYSFSKKTSEELGEIQKAGYISRFAVRGDQRTSGIGIKLLEEAECEAKALGCTALLLHSAAENKNLRDFYKNRGFTVLDTDKSRGYKRGLFIKSISN